MEPAFESRSRDTFNDISWKAVPQKDNPVKEGIPKERGSAAIRD